MKVDKLEFKNSIYQEIANVGKALASPHRLRILNLLSQDDYAVEQIANDIDISIANVSQHLQVLKKLKLVKSKKRGHYVIYALANHNVYTLWNALQNFSLQNSLEIKATLQSYREEKYANITTITAEEILANNALEDYYFLDVRPEQEFNNEAIANAKSIPIELLKDNFKQLPKHRPIIVYCRGPLCVFADDATKFLIEKGYNAMRLQEEVLEWKQKGLPVN